VAGLAGGGIIILIGAIIYGLCNLTEIILRVTGYGLLMAGPVLRGTSLKALAITTFSLAGAEVAFGLFSFIWGMMSPSLPGSPMGMSMVMGGNALSYVASLCGLAGFIVFLFYCRSVAFQLREKDIARSFLTVLIVFISYGVLATLIGCGLGIMLGVGAASAATSRSGASAGATMGALGIVAIIVFALLLFTFIGLEVWYVFVRRRLRDALDKQMRKL
jgi:hypothetical protein